MSSKIYDTKNIRVKLNGKDITPADDITIQVGLAKCECRDCEQIREAIAKMQEVLDRDRCQQTSCPAPCRAMCNNTTHQAIRRNISHLRTLLSAHQRVISAK